MSTSSKVLLGILGAAAAGVVIGLLIAPEKGTEMRSKLRKTAGDWADNLGHLWDKGKEEAENAMDEVKDKASKAANKAKESYS
ncbi:MAG: YtxH domain-containing protein [Chitinophagaceae bacterium]|nr:YtxH domain-containing protein [Chitinophagaceae bacterium]